MADDQINEVNFVEPLVQQENQVNTEPLRIANPLPESESESDSETESETDTQEHRGPHLQPVSRHQLAWNYTQQFGIQALIWIQYIWNVLSYIATTTQTISVGVMRSLQSQTYVFFQGSNYPYRLQDFSTTGPGVAPVEWYYDADKKVFLSSNLYNTTTEYTAQHLEWLSGQIKYNNLVLYDITEFLQEVKWACNLGPGDARACNLGPGAGNSKPSAARVLSAWSIHSGIVLNFVEGITLATINEDGTESILEVRG